MRGQCVTGIDPVKFYCVDRRRWRRQASVVSAVKIRSRPRPSSLPRGVVAAPRSPASLRQTNVMTLLRSMLLFALATVAEIGGAWLIWQGVREHRGAWWIGAGIIADGSSRHTAGSSSPGPWPGAWLWTSFSLTGGT